MCDAETHSQPTDSGGLRSAVFRAKGLSRLNRGIAITNQLFKISVPRPTEHRWTPHRLGNPATEDADLYYAELLAAVGDRVSDALPNCTDLLQWNRTYVGRTLPHDSLFNRIEELGKLADEALLSRVCSAFHVDPLTLTDRINDQSYCFVKMNHGFWERLCFIYGEQRGRRYHRYVKNGSDIAYSYRYVAFFELVVQALLMYLDWLSPGNPSENRFVGEKAAFGISFNKGNRRYFDDLKLPLRPNQRGAMVGACGFFSELFGDKLIFADGAAAKQLFWEGQLERFFRNIQANSDALVFVVPKHLRGIKVTGWKGPIIVVEIPASCVHQLWPSVLPYVVGYVSELRERYPRLTIFAQAAAMSVPIGIAVAMMPDRPGSLVRYFDLGQTLDIAAGPDGAAGAWARKAKVRHRLATEGSRSIYLSD